VYGSIIIVRTGLNVKVIDQGQRLKSTYMCKYVGLLRRAAWVLIDGRAKTAADPGKRMQRAMIVSRRGRSTSRVGVLTWSVGHQPVSTAVILVPAVVIFVISDLCTHYSKAHNIAPFSVLFVGNFSQILDSMKD